MEPIKRFAGIVSVAALLFSVLLVSGMYTVAYAENTECSITVETNDLVEVKLSKDTAVIGETIEISVTPLPDVEINEVFAVTEQGSQKLERLVLDEDSELLGPFIYQSSGMDTKIVVTVTAGATEVVDAQSENEHTAIDSWKTTVLIVAILLLVAVLVGIIFLARKRKKDFIDCNQ